MNYKIIPLNNFKKNIKKLQKKYPLIKNDLKELNNTLQNNPNEGIELGNNCFKIRVKNSSIPTGKRGGFRVIYYYVYEENIYLMAIYSKSEIENISNDKILEILKENGL